MWKAIESIFNGSNGVVIAILLVILIIVCAKYGLFKVKTDKITIGRESGDKERMIIRHQYDYIRLYLDSYENQIPRFEGYDTNLGRLVVAKVQLEMMKWITQNHIRTDERYIKLHQGDVWNIVQKNTVSDYFDTEEFRGEVDRVVEEIIRTLVDIRKEYSK